MLVERWLIMDMAAWRIQQVFRARRTAPVGGRGTHKSRRSRKHGKRAAKARAAAQRGMTRGMSGGGMVREVREEAAAGAAAGPTVEGEVLELA